jgi:signal transduction histidine kinase
VPHEPGEAVTIPYGQTNCTIEYISPNFHDGEEVRYLYRMAPEDDGWQGPLADARVVFASLPPGRHQFQVEAINSRGEVSITPATLLITVDTPFWEKGWFLFLVCILGGLGIAGTFRVVEVRKFRRQMARLEQARVLEKERLRIARDMHDEIGSTLTEISILGELGRRADSSSAQMQQKMEEMARKSREALNSIAEIIWAINPRNDELENFASYVRRFTLRICEQAGIRCRIVIPEDLPDLRLSAEQRRDLFLFLKEALNNVIKHAKASEVTLRLVIGDDELMLEVADNGGGFDTGAARGGGTGLMNMRHRAEEIGATFSLVSSPSAGTCVRVYLKRGIAGRATDR